jgi:hypothetical protein
VQAEEIIGLINRQISFNKKTLSHLSDMIEDYPFFQTGQLLYTLNLQANRDTGISAEIKKTACYMSDKRKFFYLIEKDFLEVLTIESEYEKKQLLSDNSFSLIDLFLKEKKEKQQKDLIHPNSQLAQTDYITYLLSEETQMQDVKIKPMLHQDAIDKFISEDSSKGGIKIVLKGKDDEEDETEEITLSEAEKADTGIFFSETLAKIYLKQKKYDKALEIILKLNLEYPEKSCYFADQIRFLEKLIINVKK